MLNEISDAPQTGYAELAHGLRGETVSHRFFGTAVLVDSDSAFLCSAGPISEPVMALDALKPLQTIACAMAGADLAFGEWAIAAANHSGTADHVRVVRELLERARLSEDALNLPAVLSDDPASHLAQLRELTPPQRIFHPSSGTHAAMLLACVNSGWPVQDYHLAEHPLQVHVKEVLERLTGEKASHEVLDDVSCVSWGFSLQSLARAMAKIGAASSASPFAMHRAAGSLVASVSADPWAIAGDCRVDTVLNRLLPVFVKSADNGILLAGVGDAGLAIRILDGNSDPLALVLLRLLSRKGIIEVSEASKAAHALTACSANPNHNYRLVPVLD